jgi:exonuclease III
MIILSWNCWGLGNPRTVQVLNRMVRTKKPNLVFLIETKLNSKKMEAIRIKLGFDAIFMVDSISKSGGLALMWNLDNVVQIQNYSRWNINVVIETDSTAKE